LTADEKLLNRIVRNLVMNAIKYSPDGGDIQVEVGEEADSAVVRVRDQGIGVAPEDQMLLFKPFFRASNSGSVEGTGMGLSIVKDCVKLHGGTISVESELGNGSTFIVRLPRVPNLEVQTAP
jgi:signal transduction histidine kinase